MQKSLQNYYVNFYRNYLFQHHMKSENLLKLSFVALAITAFVSCSKSPFEEEPKACLKMASATGEEKSTFLVDENVVFSSCASNNPLFSAVWTGDIVVINRDTVSRKYEDLGKRNAQGQSLNNNRLVYKYKNPGTYTVTLIISNSYDDGQKGESTSTSKTITIVTP